MFLHRVNNIYDIKQNIYTGKDSIALSIGLFSKVQLKVAYFAYVVWKSEKPL